MDRLRTVRRTGRTGEVILRHGPGRTELIVNGVFLMSSATEPSARELARAGLARVRGRVSVVIGGLGLGYTLAETLACPRIDHVTVVEIEPAVIDWHRSQGWLEDKRVTVDTGDINDWTPCPGTDAPGLVLLDVDNGPDWLVTPGNAVLYSAHGLRRLRRLLKPGGALGVWSADRSQALERTLAHTFGRWELVESHGDLERPGDHCCLYYGLTGEGVG